MLFSLPRMKSIADYYTPGKEKKFAGVAKKKERRDSLTALARVSLGCCFITP